MIEPSLVGGRFLKAGDLVKYHSLKNTGVKQKQQCDLLCLVRWVSDRSPSLPLFPSLPFISCLSHNPQGKQRPLWATLMLVYFIFIKKTSLLPISLRYIKLIGLVLSKGVFEFYRSIDDPYILFITFSLLLTFSWSPNSFRTEKPISRILDASLRKDTSNPNYIMNLWFIVYRFTIRSLNQIVCVKEILIICHDKGLDINGVRNMIFIFLATLLSKH